MRQISVMPFGVSASIGLPRAAFFRGHARPRPLKLRKRIAPLRAGEDPSSGVEEEEDAEERIARLEAAARGTRRDEVPDLSDTATDADSPPKRQWKEGELLPEGWEDLNPAEKAWELYAGERGALFWANKVAFAAAICLGIAWVLFRFVGPNLGLYELKSTFTS